MTYTTDQTIQPGIYHNININAGVDITMAPGNYYLNGNLQFQAPQTGKPGATLSGNGVMIYLNGGDCFHAQNAASINLSAPTSGSYRGIVLYIPRSRNDQVHIENTNSITLSGTLYGQNGFFDIRPDGSSTVFNFGSYIGYKAEFCDGNDLKSKSNGQINFNPTSGAPSQRPALVE